MNSWLKWLYPGMGVKRWVLLSLVGVFMVSAGVALLAGVEVLGIVERWMIRQVVAVTGRFSLGIIDVAAIITLLAGLALAVVGFRQTTRSILSVLAPDAVSQLVDILYEKRHRRRGPKVVAIGGGTGLSTLLRGLKEHTANITAIVAVSDDGGSSGRLRDELGVPPPGDIRNTLLALAEAEPLMQQLFEYRFEGKGALAGHSFGNLLIAALTDITGDFDAAVRESSRVLAICGQVVPGTLDDVSLRCEFTDGTRISGESRIAEVGKPIRRVSLEPARVRPNPEALRAIEEADLIVLGPGSLYTSVLPNLLIPELAEAIRRASVPKVYVCNVMTQPGETGGYTATDHVRALIDHVGQGLFDYVLMNSASIPRSRAAQYEAQGATWIAPASRELAAMGLRPVVAPLISAQNLVRHAPDRLAESVLGILEDEMKSGRVGETQR